MFWILLLSAFGPMYSVFIQTEPDCFKPESSESNLWSHHLYHSYCESGGLQLCRFDVAAQATLKICCLRESICCFWSVPNYTTKRAKTPQLARKTHKWAHIREFLPDVTVETACSSYVAPASHSTWSKPPHSKLLCTCCICVFSFCSRGLFWLFWVSGRPSNCGSL
jgi:hypothetical protein